jgi:Ca2+-binding RTX toxin-like protein
MMHYVALDPERGATVTVTSPSPGTLEFHDATSPNGLDWGPCVPLTMRRARCSAAGIDRILIEVFDGDDVVEVLVPIPTEVRGGSENDRLIGGYGADVLSGESGNDLLVGGEGTDLLDGGDGGDEIRARDGATDEISCGTGRDVLVADRGLDPATLQLALECERDERGTVAPDTGAPTLEVRAQRRQRFGSDRAVELEAWLDEPGAIAVWGWIEIRGQVVGTLSSESALPRAPGQRWELRPRAPAGLAVQVRRALAEGRRVIAVLKVIARDEARNETRRTVKVRLRRP